MKRRFQILLTILVLVVAGSWLLQQESEQPAQTVATETPAWQVEGMRLATMNDDGKPVRRLNAESVDYFSNQDISILQKPQLALLDQGDARWRISSPAGRHWHGEDKLLFEGPTRAVRSGDRELILGTHDLTVWNEQQRAETSAKVDIRRDGDRTRGRGLKADFGDQSRLEIRSDVTSTFKP